MISKKQKFRTVILILILALAIVGGVFAVSYYMGGVTFPWEVAATDADTEDTAKEPEEDEEKLVVKVVEPEEDATEEQTEEIVEEDTETTEETDTTDSNVLSDNYYDYYGQLSVVDGQLVDADGNAAQLVGVSTHGLSWYPDYASAETIQSLRENWGINTIRLATYTSDYNGYCVGGEDIQQAIKDTIDEAVTAATENDMYVIIDWHILNDGNPNEYKSEAIQFFGELVRKYADNENVIYEICNEPNGDTTWDDIRKYANEVIPVIRNVNKDAVILVGTPDYSSDLASVMENPLDFDNIMYTYHFYAGTHGSSERDDLIAALDEGMPVFISECGFVSADGTGDVDTDEANEWLDVIDEYGLSMVVWNLSNKDEGSALISADCTDTYDWTADELSTQGQFFIEWLSGDHTVDSEDGESAEEEETTETSDSIINKSTKSSKTKEN